MRLRRLVIIASLLALAALSAAARPGHAQLGAMHLSWVDCGPAGVQLRNFACNTNVGLNILVVSAIPGVDIPQLNGHASVIDCRAETATVPSWWLMQGGASGCRNVLTASFDFTFLGGCHDPWEGGASGGVSLTAPSFLGSNGFRIRTVCAIPGGFTLPILGTEEYYVARVLIPNGATVGSGSCSGCSDGVCLAVTQLTLTQPLGVGDVTISDVSPQSYVTWQPGGATVKPGGCPASVPSRRQTWGMVKALYR